MSNENDVEVFQASDFILGEVLTNHGTNYVYFKSKEDAHKLIKVLKEKKKKNRWGNVNQINLVNARNYIDYNNEATFTYQKFVRRTLHELPWLSYPFAYLIMDQFLNLDQPDFDLKLIISLSLVATVGFMLTWLTRVQIKKMTTIELPSVEEFQI